MRATQFEFNQRFWLIGLIIWVGFFLASVDHVSAAVGLLRVVRPSLDPDSAEGIFWLRVIFGCGALLVFLAAFLRTWATAYLRADVVHDSRIHSEKHVADGVHVPSDPPRSRALWQALLITGIAGFGAAIGVHPAIG